VHGFTDDPHELIESARKLSSFPHPMNSNARDVSEELARAKMAGLGKKPEMYRTMASFLWTEQRGKEESRTMITIQALGQLARSMAVFPGRKNLIWISGGIPFDPATTDPQMQRIAALLAATQFAVYPIDVRGIPFLGPDGSTLSAEAFLPRGGSYAELSGQDQELRSIHDTMTTLASLTGGHAYFNRNDLQGAISDSVESGSNYYILAYRPQNENWNGKFRKVSAKASPPNTRVQCRPGYYAVPDPLNSSDINQTFSQAMQPTSPASTTLIIKARVLPPEGPDTPTQIDFLVDVHDLSLTNLPDHRQSPDTLFVAAIWDAAGRPGGSVSASFRQALNYSQLDSLRRTGLQLHQQMQIKPGTYQLRLGVVDRLSGKIGTLDVPLTVESKVAKQ
jgi:VWFA-related protein